MTETDSTEDPILPAAITHNIDEVWIAGELEQFYNFLDYSFERGGVRYRARAYLDTPRSVTLFGPLPEMSSVRSLSELGAEMLGALGTAPQLEADILFYLRRRFSEVKTLASMVAGIDIEPGSQSG